MSKPASLSDSGEKLNIITQLRGLAALGVFLYHMVCLSAGFFGDGLLNQVLYYGKFGVQFFFVISGFVITHSLIKADYKLINFPTFFLKRVIRIEPPYLVVLFLTVLFLLVRTRTGLAHGETQNLSWQQVALHIGYLIPFSSYNWLSLVFYTLAIEFQFYLIFSLSFSFIVNNMWARWFFSIGLLALFFLSAQDYHFFYWSPVFLLGIYLSLYKKNKISATEFITVAAVLSAAIILKLGFIVFLAAAIPVLVIYFQPVIRSRILNFLGNISYSLYLVHPLTSMTLINIGRRTTTTFAGITAMAILATTLTIVCSYVLYKYLEKPFQKMAAVIQYNKNVMTPVPEITPVVVA